MKHPLKIAPALMLLCVGYYSEFPVANANNSAPSAVSNHNDIENNTALLESRYKLLEAEYTAAKKNKVDLSRLTPIISDITKAKKRRDLIKLTALLDQFEKELNTATERQSSTTPTLTKDPALSKAQEITASQKNLGSATAEENAALKKLAANPNFQMLHSKKGPATMVAEDGAVGRNKRKFSDVATQRDALWLLRNGMIINDATYISKAVLALNYAFKYQASAGYFNNDLGYNAVTAAGNDAFYIFAYSYAYQLLKEDGRFNAQFEQMKPFQQKLGSATNWLEKNQAELYRQDAKTPNRLLFDAMAFYFSSEATGITKHRSIGQEFIYKALAAQKPDGSFIEKGGYDTSYQAVNMLNLSMLYFHSTDAALKKDIRSALERAANWLTEKVASNGEVSVQGNTRTGLGQEIQSGKPKDINYPEVALSLYYSSIILERPALTDIAGKVVTYAVNNLN